MTVVIVMNVLFGVIGLVSFVLTITFNLVLRTPLIRELQKPKFRAKLYEFSCKIISKIILSLTKFNQRSKFGTKSMWFKL